MRERERERERESKLKRTLSQYHENVYHLGKELVYKKSWAIEQGMCVDDENVVLSKKNAQTITFTVHVSASGRLEA